MTFDRRGPGDEGNDAPSQTVPAVPTDSVSVDAAGLDAAVSGEDVNVDQAFLELVHGEVARLPIEKPEARLPEVLEGLVEDVHWLRTEGPLFDGEPRPEQVWTGVLGEQDAAAFALLSQHRGLLAERMQELADGTVVVSLPGDDGALQQVRVEPRVLLGPDAHPDPEAKDDGLVAYTTYTEGAQWGNALRTALEVSGRSRGSDDDDVGGGATTEGDVVGFVEHMTGGRAEEFRLGVRSLAQSEDRMWLELTPPDAELWAELTGDSERATPDDEELWKELARGIESDQGEDDDDGAGDEGPPLFDDDDTEENEEAADVAAESADDPLVTPVGPQRPTLFVTRDFDRLADLGSPELGEKAAMLGLRPAWMYPLQRVDVDDEGPLVQLVDTTGRVLPRLDREDVDALFRTAYVFRPEGEGNDHDGE